MMPASTDQALGVTIVDAGSTQPCELDFVQITEGELSFDVFRYEASGAEGNGACSGAGQIPRHSVSHAQAAQSCESIGWRLCSLAEISRGCGGADGRRFPYGSRLIEGRCNIKDAYVPDGEERATVAPTGFFSQCVSEDGIFDLTGNLWEWVALEGDTYVYYGAGFQIIAERHRDDDHGCGSYITLPAVVGADYLKHTLGFRCCRDSER
jgi:formylglycine-generating enzyme required for sulfatase activity